MQQVQVNEPIEVLAAFKKSGLAPLFFKWNGRKIKIEAVDLKYKFKRGDTLFRCFLVSCANASYKIICDSQNMSWTIEEVSSN